MNNTKTIEINNPTNQYNEQVSCIVNTALENDKDVERLIFSGNKFQTAGSWY